MTRDEMIEALKDGAIGITRNGCRVKFKSKDRHSYYVYALEQNLNSEGLRYGNNLPFDLMLKYNTSGTSKWDIVGVENGN